MSPPPSLLFLFLADIPASGQLHEIMTVSYTVQNRTSLVQEVEAKMGQSEAFMYAGNRVVSVIIIMYVWLVYP